MRASITFTTLDAKGFKAEQAALSCMAPICGLSRYRPSSAVCTTAAVSFPYSSPSCTIHQTT